MATPEEKENCHYVKKDPHRCKIKLEKFHFDILRCYRVIKVSFLGDVWNRPLPGEVGLRPVHMI